MPQRASPRPTPQRVFWLMPFFRTSVSLNGSVPIPPVFPALDQWHNEPPKSALAASVPVPRVPRLPLVSTIRLSWQAPPSARALALRRRCDLSRRHPLVTIMPLLQSQKSQPAARSLPGLCLVSIPKYPKNPTSPFSASSRSSVLPYYYPATSCFLCVIFMICHCNASTHNALRDISARATFWLRPSAARLRRAS